MPDALKIDVTQVPQTTQDFTDLRHLLAAVIRDLHAKHVLEIGTDVGDSTRIFSAILQETGGQLWTVDLVPPKGNWHTTWPIGNVQYIQADSRTLQWGQKVDLLFLDGNHTYEYVSHELAHLGPWVRAGGRILLHDTLHSEFGPGITKAIWEWTTTVKFPWTQYPYQHGLGVIEVTYDIPPLPVPVLAGPRVS